MLWCGAGWCQTCPHCPLGCHLRAAAVSELLLWGKCCWTDEVLLEKSSASLTRGFAAECDISVLCSFEMTELTWWSRSVAPFSNRRGRRVWNTKQFGGSASFLTGSRSFMSAGNKKYFVCLILFIKKKVFIICYRRENLDNEFQVPCSCSAWIPLSHHLVFSWTLHKKEVKSWRFFFF